LDLLVKLLTRDLLPFMVDHYSRRLESTEKPVRRGQLQER